MAIKFLKGPKSPTEGADTPAAIPLPLKTIKPASGGFVGFTAHDPGKGSDKGLEQEPEQATTELVSKEALPITSVSGAALKTTNTEMLGAGLMTPHVVQEAQAPIVVTLTHAADFDAVEVLVEFQPQTITTHLIYEVLTSEYGGKTSMEIAAQKIAETVSSEISLQIIDAVAKAWGSPVK